MIFDKTIYISNADEYINNIDNNYTGIIFYPLICLVCLGRSYVFNDAYPHINNSYVTYIMMLLNSHIY